MRPTGKRYNQVSATRDRSAYAWGHRQLTFRTTVSHHSRHERKTSHDAGCSEADGHSDRGHHRELDQLLRMEVPQDKRQADQDGRMNDEYGVAVPGEEPAEPSLSVEK